MNYLSNFVVYVYSFFKEDDTILLYESYIPTPKPFFQYQFLDDIDFNNTSTSDIVIKLNSMKHKFFFGNRYDNVYNDIYNKNKLNKLKFVLLSCLESKNDTTYIMIKHVKKYKGEKIILDIIEEDKEYKELEKRYIKLIEDNNQDNQDNNQYNNQDNNNNTDGMDCVKVGNKKRIALLN